MRRLMACFCLLICLLSWEGGARGLPVLWMILGSSHRAFFAEIHGKPHLLLHHPGDQDEHELPAADWGRHQCDLLDNLLTLFTAGQVCHFDHVIHLPDCEQASADAAKKMVGMSSQMLQVGADLASMHSLSLPSPKPSPPLVFLRTTVLRI